jgi:hypothetical protein
LAFVGVERDSLGAPLVVPLFLLFFSFLSIIWEMLGNAHMCARGDWLGYFANINKCFIISLGSRGREEQTGASFFLVCAVF